MRRSWLVVVLLGVVIIGVSHRQGDAAEEQPSPSSGAAEAPFRLVLLGDPEWSAGTVRPALQALGALNGVALEVREIPAKGRPLEEILAGLVSSDQLREQSGYRYGAVVVYGQAERLLVQRKPGVLADNLQVLSALAPRVLWVLQPMPRINAALEAERVQVLERAGNFPALLPLSSFAALSLIQKLGGSASWINDLTFDRATSLGDFVTAILIAASLWEIKKLPTEIRLGSGASLTIPEEALPVLAQLATAVHTGELALPEINWDYAPELAEPVQLRTEQGPFFYNGTGMVPSLFDWQGDGRPELILSARGTGECQVWTFNGSELGSRPVISWKMGSPNCPWNTLSGNEVTVFQVLDFNQDRRPDFLVGTGTGELVLIRSRTDGTFGDAEKFVNQKGESLRIPYLFSAQLGHLHKELTWTLVAGDQAGNVFLVFQQGSIEKPVWTAPAPLQIGRWELQLEGATAPAFVDWDRDGRMDLLIGSRSGSIVWVRNVGSEENPAWDFPLTLVTPIAEESVLPIPHRGNGRGELWRPCPGWSPCPIAADINGDHLPDLILGDVNRRVVRFRDLTPEERAEVESLLKRRDELLPKMDHASAGEESALRAALWEVTLALLEKSRDRRYERCSWVWYLERKVLAAPRP
ncbi:FG-GAP repeat domain-containing protein [Thermogutta sp.]|uniref:FG-GAP repeat domain-containing protein n=1 Tax=Thermogutta sp. TaxID=1962930 RepID=UPI003C7A3DF4